MAPAATSEKHVRKNSVLKRVRTMKRSLESNLSQLNLCSNETESISDSTWDSFNRDKANSVNASNTF